jgi:L-ascorbate metabolism protein UlaG (beta-lactamase superfamily)
MQITAKGEDRFEIQTKLSKITTGEQTVVNEVELAGPGEYEIGDCKITGLPPQIYLIEAEDLKIVYLDRLNRQLSDSEIDRLGEPDILFVPTGSNGTIDPKAAEQLVNLVDPKVVIPITGDVGSFCKFVGGCPPPVASFKVSKQSVPEQGRKVVTLEK